MRVLRCFLVATGLLALSCAREAPGPSIQGTKGSSAAEKGPDLTRRPLEERLLGNWATKDPGPLRGVRFAKENAVTFAIQQEGRAPQTMTGKYQLTGKVIQLDGQVGGSEFRTVKREVIEAGGEYLILQGFDESERKPQRFTRE